MWFLWWVYYPLIKVLGYLFFWLPILRERKKFEKKNFVEPLCASFKQSSIKADLCFEFSSEGEFQQIASLVEDAISMGKRVELVFFSPSVEKTVVEFANRNPDRIRYLRYPLATFSPWRGRSSFTQWISSSTLILVRYDLFPEFLIWGQNPKHDLRLVWVSFKRDRLTGKKISWIKRKFLSASSRLIYASGADGQQGKDLGYEGFVYDFRMEQIRRRISQRHSKFKELFPQYPQILKSLESKPRSKRLIFGNVWPSDLFLLKGLPSDFVIVVVPHKLTPEILSEFRKGLEDLGRSTIDVVGSLPPRDGDTFLINKKGILCELYADFGLAYVGGGFETSIHSILEPLVAGADKIGCGPLHLRSTEFDVAQDMNKVTEVNTPQEFLDWLLNGPQSAPGGLKAVFDQYPQFRKEVISC